MKSINSDTRPTVLICLLAKLRELPNSCDACVKELTKSNALEI